MAIQEIRVGLKEEAETQTVYRFEGISRQEAGKLAREALTDPVTQKFEVNAAVDITGTKPVEIGYKPGVMNPVEASLIKAAHYLGIIPAAASSSTLYCKPDISGQRILSQVETIIKQKPETLLISGVAGPVEIIPVSTLQENELEALSEKRRLFLDTNEMRVIQSHFRGLRREPTDVELETLAQTWSEHNGHKTFKAKLVNETGDIKSPLIKRIRKTSEKYFDKAGVVTAFNDNAGGIRFYDGEVIIAKGETHNSPVAVEPYGGSLTKNGGVYRDIAGCGQGGINLLGIMVNCFGYPETKPENVPAGCLHPLNLLLENSRGERDYGNRMGIPTHATSLHFHPDFGPKPTSMGIVVGIIPESRSHKGQPQPGDLLITVGGKTGRDGLHGATFSSGEMTASTSVIDATAVQIGNAIEEKRMFDALIAARDANLIQAITDCGGGGYSSAIGEIAENTGVDVYLDKVPQKYAGLAPWEIWLSESQERMMVAISPGDWKEFQKICEVFDTPADIIGLFTGDHRLTIYHEDNTVAQLSMNFLHHGLPQRVMPIKYEACQQNDELPAIPTDLVGIYKNVLGHLNVCSKEAMLRQYDQTVQGKTALAPFTGIYQDIANDASVVAPLYGKPYGVITAHALNPILNRIDPYEGTLWTVTQAISKYTAAGGNIHEAALIDNFVWPKPDTKHLADLDRSVDALCLMMDTFKIPCVSGKDSLSSSYKAPDGKLTHIPPVLNITVFGRIKDVEKTVSADIKSANSTLVLVGWPDINNLGGSVYFRTQNIENTHLPRTGLGNLPSVIEKMRLAIQSGKVKSCKAIGEGGLATTLALMCFGGDCGADIDIGQLAADRVDFALFNETAGCFVVEVKNKQEALKLFGLMPHRIIGRTTTEKVITVKHGKSELFSAGLHDLKNSWQKPMKEVLG